MRFRDVSELRQALKGSDIELPADLPKPPPRKRGLPKDDHLARQFEGVWALIEGPDLIPEYRFHTVREWRADYAHPSARVTIEIEGGTRNRNKPGRHNRHDGYRDDCIKYNAATLEGWCVFRFTSDMLDAENLRPVADFIRQRNHDDA